MGLSTGKFICIVAGVGLAVVASGIYVFGRGRATESYDRRQWYILRDIGSAIDEFAKDHGRFPAMRPHPTVAGATTWEPGTSESPGLELPKDYLAEFRPINRGRHFPLTDHFSPGQGELPAYYTDGKGWILYARGANGRFDIDPSTQFRGDQEGGGEAIRSIAKQTNFWGSAADVVVTAK